MIDKFLGDGVLVLWGVYGEHPDKESRAIAFFEKLKKELKLLNEANAQWNFPKLKVGAGMSSGQVTVGILGDDIKMEYTAVGPVVNLASRLESLCKIHQTECIVSIEFLNRLKNSEKNQFNVITEEYINGIGSHIKNGHKKNKATILTIIFSGSLLHIKGIRKGLQDR